MLSTSKGVSSVALARTIGVNQKTAWKMGHAIRQMMIAHDDVCGRLDGEVEADEAFVGGEPKFKSGEAPHKRGRGTGKPIVLMAVSRLQRQVRAELIPAATTAVVDPLLREWITSRSTLNTDGSTIYDAVGLKFDAHLKVNHREREYADRKSGATTNTAEAFAANIERARETRSCNPISRSPE